MDVWIPSVECKCKSPCVKFQIVNRNFSTPSSEDEIPPMISSGTKISLRTSLSQERIKEWKLEKYPTKKIILQPTGFFRSYNRKYLLIIITFLSRLKILNFFRPNNFQNLKCEEIDTLDINILLNLHLYFHIVLIAK